jgi:putative sporulation protein YtaF
MFRIILLILAVTVDGLAAAVSMGCGGIHIPVRSAAVLSFTGTAFLAVSVILSERISGFFPPIVGKIISAALLVALGLINIFKERLRKRFEPGIPESNRSIIFLDELKSDTDHNKIISLTEAGALSVALSADSLATGAASARITSGYLILTLTITFVTGLAFILFGNRLGCRFAACNGLNFEKICGVILILLAAVNFF